MKTFTLLLALAAVGVADDAMPGAKKLFYEPVSDALLKDPKPAAGGGTGPIKPKPPVGGGKLDLAKTATGVHCEIELQTPDGKMKIVPASTVFHTGDRFRLHVQSNVDGRLVVMWNQEKGPYHLLFPPDPNMDNRVKKFGDNVFPPKFFRFDENPGDISMMLMVTADGATPNMIAVTAPLHVDPAPPSRQAPATPRTAPVLAPAPPADTKERTEYARQMQEEYVKLKNGKGLALELDDTGPNPSTTVVAVPWRDRNITPGVVVAEIKLTHRP